MRRHCERLPEDLQQKDLGMATPTTELSPQERLAISRKAIVRHMNRHHQEVKDHNDDGIVDAQEEARSSSRGTLGMVRHAARVWWQRHPASAAAELARPLLSDYASAHPFKLLGIAAAVGAAAVVIRPWRMVSVGTLVVAAVKSSGLTNTLISMISSMSMTHHAENTNPRTL
ncbi:MAG: hypothetical protein JWR60_2957 [Polaromonas sp.]|nr:hypothetical protein [Polaromonas sp.]